MSLSDTQYTLIAWLPKIASTFSAAGSTWILVEVFTHQLKRQQVYHRLLAAMSIYDIIESFFNFASTWFIPEGTENIHDTRGNIATCDAQGFILQFGIAIPIYNAWLAVYYWMLVVRGMTEQDIKKGGWEWAMHISAFVVAFSTALTTILLKLNNNATLWCFMSPSPAGCDRDPNVPCERGGENHHIYRWAFYYAPLWLCILTAMVFVILIIYHVKMLENKSNKAKNLAQGKSLNSVAMSKVQQRLDVAESIMEDGEEVGDTMEDDSFGKDKAAATEIVDEMDEDDNANRAQKTNSTQQVVSQCLWYLAAFYITHTFSTANRAVGLKRGSGLFGLLVLHSFIDPFQGFLNFLIYRRPLYLRYRRLQPNIGRWKCWYLAFRWHFTFDAERERAQILMSKAKARKEKAQKSLRSNAEFNASISPRKPPNSMPVLEEDNEEDSDAFGKKRSVMFNQEQAPESALAKKADLEMGDNSSRDWGALGFTSVEGMSKHEPYVAANSGSELKAVSEETEQEDDVPQPLPPKGPPKRTTSGTVDLGKVGDKDWGVATLGFSSTDGASNFESYAAAKSEVEHDEEDEEFQEEPKTLDEIRKEGVKNRIEEARREKNKTFGTE